jgi:crotonobetainyl-CoA:carnitine CoA-transferase CaiB-like acyl-CoA transferase
VDYATLHGRFPRLIHASLSGVGKKGPERDLPGYDATALWFRSGMHYVLAQRGIGGMGWRAGFGDTVAGMSLFAGIMTALYNRERTGVGQQVDLSLFNIGIYQLSHDMSAFLATGTDFREMIARMVEDEGDTPRMRKRAELLAAHETATRGLREFFMEQVQTPLAVHYQTKDGRNFHINILQGDRYYPRICRVIGREDLIDDPRWATHEERTANGPELYRIMRDAFLAKTLDEWRPIMIRGEIPWAPEQTIREVINDPQARANDFFVPFDHPTYGAMEVVANPIKLSDTPATTRLPAPEFSQHTEEVLLEADYSWEDIARFKEDGIIP